MQHISDLNPSHAGDVLKTSTLCWAAGVIHYHQRLPKCATELLQPTPQNV